MPTCLVELRDVAKHFGDGPTVLDGISLQADVGELVALIGPSGCGKSTLLRLIAGLTPVSAGSILVDGAAPEAAAASLGFVFQDATLLPWQTVEQNIELPLKLRGVPADVRRDAARRVLELVRLADRGRAMPRELSGGQKMRVSLARAFALHPKLLLLDEPFGALDEITREHLNEELLAIREQQAWTAFFVTHSVAEAVFLSSRVIVLSANPGRIHAEVPVPLGYPRTAETRMSREYLNLVAHASRVLRDAGAIPAGA